MCKPQQDRLDEIEPQDFSDDTPAGLEDASPATKYVWHALAWRRTIPECPDEQTSSELIEWTQIGESTVRAHLTELCDRGFAESRVDPNDVRSTLYRARWPVADDD